MVDVREQNFLRWFDGSKVVDGNGRPVVNYHGTNASVAIKKFSGNAFAGWFAEYPNTADAYTSSSLDDDCSDSAIYPVLLSIKSPLDLSGIDANELFNPEKLAIAMGVNLADVSDLFEDRAAGDAYWNLIDTPNFREWVGALGYDGLAIMERGQITWAVLRPEQIKSAAGNCGDFDPNNPDITR